MLKYPSHSPLEFEDIKNFARKVGSGEFLNDTAVLNKVNNTEVIELVEREVGESLNSQSMFNNAALGEGTDAVVLLYSSGTGPENEQAFLSQKIFVDNFIRCMKKFKEMKPKIFSHSFFAVDTNSDHQVIGKAAFGHKGFYNVIMYPAFHKDISEVPRLR